MRSLAALVAAATLALALPIAAAGARSRRPAAAIERAIDHARARHGLRALRHSRALARVAGAHSHAMLRANVLTHGAFVARVRPAAHTRTIGEALGWTSRCSARRIVGMWLASPVHRELLLARRFHRVGVGVRTGRLGRVRACVVTADFAA